MKFLNYIAIFALFSQLAAAQSISDQELQDRFNKAFSVFNKQAPDAEIDMAKMSENKEQQAAILADEKTIEFNKGAKNIVKSSNGDVVKTKKTYSKTEQISLHSDMHTQMSPASDFVLLKDRQILIDLQNATLSQIIQDALNQAAYDDKWTVKWRLKDENKYILEERMNLTAEVDFDSFVGNMLETITNITGIRLSTKVFNKNRIIIITDSF